MEGVTEVVEVGFGVGYGGWVGWGEGFVRVGDYGGKEGRLVMVFYGDGIR